MNRSVEWRHLWREGGGVERVDIADRRAHGRVVCDSGTDPFELTYDVRWNPMWRTRFVEYRVADGRGTRFKWLAADEEGRWAVDGLPDRRLDGCIDVDIWPTPFTNTLAIRRLTTPGSDGGEILVAWLDAVAGAVQARPQRYTRSARGWLFESLDDGFSAELTVDDDGLVVDYPGLFERVA